MKLHEMLEEAVLTPEGIKHLIELKNDQDERIEQRERIITELEENFYIEETRTFGSSGRILCKDKPEYRKMIDDEYEVKIHSVKNAWEKEKEVWMEENKRLEGVVEVLRNTNINHSKQLEKFNKSPFWRKAFTSFKKVK